MQSEGILNYCGTVIPEKKNKKAKPKTTAKPWEKLHICFLEAKKSGLDGYFCEVIIMCPLLNVSCTFRLTWAEV